MKKEDIESLEVKDRILVIKSDDVGNVDFKSFESVRKQWMERGCLGVVMLPSDSSIESLGISQLEEIVKQIKERKASEGKTNK